MVWEIDQFYWATEKVQKAKDEPMKHSRSSNNLACAYSKLRYQALIKTNRWATVNTKQLYQVNFLGMN